MICITKIYCDPEPNAFMVSKNKPECSSTMAIFASKNTKI